MTELLKTFLTHFTYIALILILMSAGFGVPIPEDVPLIFSGMLCHPVESPLAQIDTDDDGIPDSPNPDAPHRHIPNRYLMMVAGMIGVLGGDSIVFTIGRRGLGGSNFIARHLRKVMHSKRRERLERHFHNHGNLTVFFGRFMPGGRSIVFAMAGLSRMGYLRFLLIDGMAALISVPLFIFLGFHFAAKITQLFLWLHHAKEVFAPIFIAALASVVAIYLIRRRRRQLATRIMPPAAPTRDKAPLGTGL